MKKVLLSTVAMMAFGFMSAQEEVKSTSEVKFGAKGGINLANIVGDDAGDANMFVGFNAGFFVEIPVTEKLTIQPEILYSAQGSKSEGPLVIDGSLYDVKATMKFNYINIPVMFKYNVVEKFSLEAGPYIGFLTTAKIKVDVNGFGSATEDMKDLVKSTDFGIALGMNYEFSDVIFANARYQGGLSQIGDTGEGDNIKNSVFQLGLGFRF
ncbi:MULTISPECIES: porin family protein [unclassified Flavobacterium]|uniref:porin family protein n=1 Tax=unclassified Flavobacterium TaxID=196869 RepID=UPI0012913241|nr:MULTISPECIES: porin family protein [unclassified Flavobacterium]MQP53124.1 outer membrane beta-barrel protein [Flavobacterium sp. LMO9]MQP62765.1 outer membrane beta-barrel protein [Flavobacterium sp. LMO6]